VTVAGNDPGARAQLLAPDLKARIENATADCLQRAQELFGRTLPAIEIRFDLRGRAAGMYVRRGRHRCIRYHPALFSLDPSHHLEHTVPHEVAHYVTDLLHRRRVRPHGQEWRAVMTALGAVPRATGDYSLEGIPLRRERRHSYRCGCGEHLLTARRHHRVQRGRMVYVCRRCRQPLVHSD